MRNNSKTAAGFTVVELLVVIAVIALLAALLMPALSAAKNKAKPTSCSNHLRQISMGILLYADDHKDPLLGISITDGMPWAYEWRFFKELTKSYDGLNGPSSAENRLFACPADTVYYHNSASSQLFHTPMHDDPWAVEPTGGSRSARFVLVSQERLPSVAHAWCWTAT